MNTTKGARVTGRVRQLLTSGLVVDLDDGRIGRVRPREIAWDPEVRRDWRSRYRVGDPVEVRVLPPSDAAQPELSLRMADRDPWDDLPQRLDRGQVVVGVVTGIEPYGAFVDLEPGVTGLLHFSRLPPAVAVRPFDVFWPGDHVRVTVEDVDVERRRIALSAAQLPPWRPSPSTRVQDTEAPDSLPGLGDTGYARQLERLAEARRPLSILLAMQSGPEATSLTAWLDRAGHLVQCVTSIAEASAVVSEIPFEVLLIDSDLLPVGASDGVADLTVLQPDARAFVIADPDGAERILRGLDSDAEHCPGVLLRPLMPEDIVDSLANDAPADVAGGGAGTPGAQRLAVASSVTAESTTAAIRDHLGTLIQRTSADKAILFQVDAARRQVTVMTALGREALRARATADLIHSPVRDAAEDGLVVRITEADRADAALRHLRPLLDFSACYGVPVSAEVANHHALFLFFADSRGLTRAAEAQVRATATAVGSILERAQFALLAADLQRLAFLGSVDQTLVHEINHGVQMLLLEIDDAKHVANGLRDGTGGEATGASCDMDTICTRLDDIAEGVYKLADTLRLFRQLATRCDDQLIRLDEALVDVVGMMERVARREGVTVALDAPPGLIVTRAHLTHLQQILINIVANAVQQIAAHRPGQGGHVTLRVERLASDGQAYIRIRIADDGPGIHRRLWDRVFDMGYTTRRDREQGGSGLGLYICRLLASQMGGRVFVGESYILSGSEFIVELPFNL